MKRHLPPLLTLALLAALALSACSSTPSWVRGDWHYDGARTEEALKSPAAGSATASDDHGTLGNLMSGLAATILVQQFSGMEVIINGTDRIVTVAGQGKSEPYQVVRSSSDECVLKLKDNTVETYYRDGDDIYTYSSGGGTFKIYLKRQP